MLRPKLTGAISSPFVLVVCLWACAALLAIGGLVYGAVRLIVAADHGQLDAFVLLGSLGYVLAGLSAGCALWAMAYVVGHLPRPEVGQRQGDAAEAASPSRPQSAWPDSNLAQRLLAELSEINTNLLMTEDQRRAKQEHRKAQLSERLAAEAREAIEAEDFETARRAAERLRDEFGDAKGHDLLLEQIDEARKAAQADQLASGIRRVEELMSVSSFSQAQETARELAAQYANSAEAQSLLERVRREAGTFVEEQRKRLFGEVQRAAEARQWHTAFVSAQKLLAEYPNSREAEKVARRLPTIQENARIEEARQLRDEIRQLLDRRRYVEAVRIARDVLSRFPDTQVATDLRPQMERLEELAEGH